MTYTITQDGIRQDERRQLIQLAGISPEDQDAIINLFYLSVTLLQGTAHKKRSGAKKGGGGAEGYDVSRYVPPLKRVLEDSLSPTGLSLGDFPFVAPPESLASARKQQASKPKGAGGAPEGVPATGRRLIVFMLGGLSYSELRSVHEVERATNREVLVGTTNMITPQTFLLALKQMKQLDTVALV